QPSNLPTFQPSNLPTFQRSGPEHYQSSYVHPSLLSLLLASTGPPRCLPSTSAIRHSTDWRPDGSRSDELGDPRRPPALPLRHLVSSDIARLRRSSASPLAAFDQCASPPAPDPDHCCRIHPAERRRSRPRVPGTRD